jgi:hypothetical protein
VIAGEHAEAARRKSAADWAAELGGEVCNRVRSVREAIRPPGVPRGARVIERFDARS